MVIFLVSFVSSCCPEAHKKPNPPSRRGKGEKFKVSLLLGERFRERFFRYGEKSVLPLFLNAWRINFSVA